MYLFLTFLRKLHLDILLNIIIIITISSFSQFRHLFFPFYYLLVTAFCFKISSATRHFYKANGGSKLH